MFFTMQLLQMIIIYDAVGCGLQMCEDDRISRRSEAYFIAQ